MSIVSEIERIQNAKTSIKTAIENKGVEVGEGTIDTYASKIDEITTGGGDTTIEDSLVERTITGSYTNNRIETVGENAFRGTKISEFNSTSVKTVSSFAFYYVANLEECNIPNVTNILGNGAFTNCTSLKKINFPKNTSGLGTNCFGNCTTLSYVNIGNCPWISSNAFSNCSNLETLIITKTSGVTSMSNTNVLTGTAIANGTGYIYVADKLYENYLTATNWSTYASQIKKISELPEGVEL
jgi:hypothetical protein